MELSEEIFWINSKHVCQILIYFHQSKHFNVVDKLMICIKGIDRFVNDFGLSQSDKLSLYNRNRNLFAIEFDYDNKKDMREKMQSEYRVSKKLLDTLLSNSPLSIHYEPVIKVFDSQSFELHAIVKKITNILKKDKTVLLEDLISSYIHMYINRLIPTNSRFNEFVIYEYLNRHFISVVAKEKKAMDFKPLKT